MQRLIRLALFAIMMASVTAGFAQENTTFERDQARMRQIDAEARRAMQQRRYDRRYDRKRSSTAWNRGQWVWDGGRWVWVPSSRQQYPYGSSVPAHQHRFDDGRCYMCGIRKDDAKK
ncbi:hypothetical protein [Prevotella histicola]